jgi:beta-lactamase regulating signal transducer with metallopeptidase domain
MSLYLLKANICLSIFTMIYWVFLRNNTFYKINRIYFLLVILISAIFPLLNLSDFVNQHQEITQHEIVKSLPDLSLLSQNQEIITTYSQNTTPVNPTISINYQDIFEAIFMAGIIIFLCKLIVQIISIFNIYRQSKSTNINGVEIRNLEENISPFSFFNLIFINVKQHSASDLAEIITHEHTHARQGHSYDVMLVELFCVAFWINPFAWLLRKFMKQNLEFLTDKTVLNSGFNAKNYQYNLLKINGLNISSLTNSFNLSDLKMRIKMMNRKRSSNLHLVKYSLMIPFGALLILAFNITKAKPFDVQKSVFQNLKETVKAVEFVGEDLSKHSTKIQEEKNPIEESILELQDGIMSDSIEIKKQNQPKYQMVSVDFKIIDSKTQKPLEGVQILDREKNSLGRTNFQGIGFIDYPMFIRNLNDERYINKECGCKSVLFQYKDFPIYEATLPQNSKSFTFVFDNGRFQEKLPDWMKSDKFSFEMTEEEKKSKNWTKMFNDRIKEHSLTTLRSDGSVWIEPKTKWFYCKEDMIKELKQSQELSEDKRPVYMTNGKVVAPDYKFEDLSIHSVVNLRYWNPEDGEKMSGKYGEQARNGMYDLMVLEKVILPKKEYKDVLYATDYVPVKVERCTPSSDFPTNATYIVDGKEVDSGYLHKNVKPEDITSLKVLQPEILPTIKDKKGKKGVILISTKKNDKLR